MSDAAIAAIGIALPLLGAVLAFLLRATARWALLTEQIGNSIRANEAAHGAMVEQMRADRESMDKRLRFVEEAFMRGGVPRGA